MLTSRQHKINFRIILCLFLFLSVSNLYSQISIEANNSVSGRKFKIDIDENSQKYFITLKILDSVSTSKNYENKMEKYRKQYFSLKNKSIKSNSVKSISRKMEILNENNSYYSTFKTEIIKNKFEKFDSLVKLFKVENSDFFEKKEANKNRIVLDGTTVKIYVNNHGINKTIWSHSPREKSHPEINDLLTSTLDILRGKNIISNEKTITSGY